MFYHLRGLLAFTGRLMLCAIFFVSAVAHKVPNFEKVAEMMAQANVPEPRMALAGAIGILAIGSLAVMFGFFARLGAFFLLVFLAAASYYFHPFWKLEEGVDRQQMTIDFMKNVGLMGAMLLIMANGAGPWSIDGKSGKG